MAATAAQHMKQATAPAAASRAAFASLAAPMSAVFSIALFVVVVLLIIGRVPVRVTRSENGRRTVR